MKEEAGSVPGRICGKDRASLVMDNLFTLNFQGFEGSHENGQIATAILFQKQKGELYGKER